MVIQHGWTVKIMILRYDSFYCNKRHENILQAI